MNKLVEFAIRHKKVGIAIGGVVLLGLGVAAKVLLGKDDDEIEVEAEVRDAEDSDVESTEE